jgi:pyruvate/2-oxoglutarate dehydrogenase complex dihydrolipoamide acyltransferase (E2) component
MTNIVVPDGLWDTVTTPEGVVINWFFDDGASVEKGAPLVEIMVAKTQFQIEAPTAGRLTISAPIDTPVTPGSVLGVLQA